MGKWPIRDAGTALCPTCGMDSWDHCTVCRGCLVVSTPDGLVCESRCEG